jgi:molybdate transport system regulatory protein
MTRPFSLRGALWISAGEDAVADAQRIELLVKIDELGSISRAAKAMGWGYKSAWDAVESMDAFAGEPLVAKAVGGRGGGGTRLTEHGRELVKTFRLLEREHRRFIEALDQDAVGLADGALLSRRTSMKTSAGNQIPGRVSAVFEDEIEIDIGGNQRLAATVMSGIRERLGLAIGLEIFALVPASLIRLDTKAENSALFAGNHVSGSVRRIGRGTANADVLIDLPNGGNLVANVSLATIEALAVAEGDVVTAAFKPSAVILAVPD